MYEYFLIISLNDYSVELNFLAFDELEAKRIAILLTENLKGFKNYTLLRKEYKRI